MIEPTFNRRSPVPEVEDRAAVQSLLGRRDGVMLCLLLAGAALARLAFFNGPFGSDDGVYLQADRG